MTIDFEKLLDIRARHSDLHDSYRTLADKARQAAQHAARMHAEAAADHRDTSARDLLALPANEIAAIPSDELAKAGIDMRTVRRVIDAYRQANRLRRDSEILAARVHASRALLDRLNAFAQQSPEAL